MAITRRHFVGGALAASASVAVGRQSIGRPKSSDLNFLIIGDWGDSGSVGQRLVAAAMKNATSYAPPRFVASVGDNFYPRGVSDPIDEAWLNSYERVYDPVALGCPWYAILGNHDHKGSVAAQIEYSEKSRRWMMPSAYYRRIEPIAPITEAEFFYLDTTPLVSQQPSVWSRWISGTDPDEQFSWLESCLRSSSAVWKIVVGHHPIVSAGPHGASPKLVERYADKCIIPIFEP
ncbi:MAG: metallophosphoesterase [Hyphomicrobium sp.]|uniref:metallophosphoesterase n=1 Tax=Hyphomicrobium sp. TaxID=82 RepID=UPI00344C9F4C|nr:metallophosphoesterase [Hyphomicrobium sp.]